jgi:deoxyribose-phosphate aldolase
MQSKLADSPASIQIPSVVKREEYTYEEIAGMIDHALLHPTLSEKELVNGCHIAHLYLTATVCVKPCDVQKASLLLADSSTEVCTVIGFPHGANTQEVKVRETQIACEEGAREVDLVLNLGRVADADWNYVQNEVCAVREVAHVSGAKLKVIFENDYWTQGGGGLSADGVKEKLCQICTHAGADLVKTSTGFGYVRQDDGHMLARGATEHDVALMVHACSGISHVKAAGGVKDLSTLLRMRTLGASRIGTSSTKQILDECRSKLELSAFTTSDSQNVLDY